MIEVNGVMKKIGKCYHVTRNRPVDFVTANFTTSYSRSSDKTHKCNHVMKVAQLMLECNGHHQMEII